MRVFTHNIGKSIAASVLVLVLSCAPSARAQQRDLKTDHKDSLDLVLVLDASASMLVTDPLRLRDEGAKLLIEFLHPGDRIGIVSFSGTATVVRPLGEFSQPEADTIRKDIGKIEANGLFTDLYSGVQQAMTMLEESPRESASQVIVLLSDGKMDPDPSIASASLRNAQLIDTVLPDLKLKGIRVYTLFFSDQADKNALNQIAQTTDGISWYTPDPGKIHESYADLFLSVKKPQMVALTGKGFSVDADITEATFYINREGDDAVTLKSPKGRELTIGVKDPEVRWFHGQKFDVVTVSNPEVGQWQIEGLPKNEGFATVLTNLKLESDWPISVNSGTPVLLQARLYDADKPVTLPSMSGVTRFGFRVTPTDRVSEPIIKDFLVDDGTQGDKIAGDGIFSALVTIDDPGEYKLRIVAQSPTFERNQQISFRVKPALVSLSLVALEQDGRVVREEGAGEHRADESEESASPSATATPSRAREYFRLELSDEAAQLKKLQIRLEAVDEKHRIYKMPLSQAPEHTTRYDAPAAALPHDGKYELTATILGEGRNKKDVKSTSKTLYYRKTTVNIDESVTLATVEHKEEPKVPGFPWLAIVIATAANVIAAIMAMKKVKSISADAGPPIPDFTPPASITTAIAELEAKIALTEISLDDPLFTTNDEAEGEAVAPSNDEPAAPNEGEEQSEA